MSDFRVFHQPTVRAGGPVTAPVIAPRVGSIVENDSTIETDHPWPDLPASIVDEILTEGGAAYADVLAARDEMAADIADLLAELAADTAAGLERLGGRWVDGDLYAVFLLR
ncbi:MAG: hypothetical protein R6U98_20510 [Pirellulaceae bacterium]